MEFIKSIIEAQSNDLIQAMIISKVIDKIYNFINKYRKKKSSQISKKI